LPTILNNLTLTGTTTIYDNLDIQANNVSFSTGSYATTSKYGVGQIATIAELDAGTAASTDSALDAAGPNFVTPQGLEHWKIYNRLVSQRTTTTQIYVIPDWNGTSFNADKTLDAMLLDPPTTLATAVTFTSACLWASTVLSPSEAGVYNLAAGIYTRSVNITHNANVVGASSPINSYSGPTSATMATSYNNPSVQTLFAPSAQCINFLGPLVGYFGGPPRILSSAPGYLNVVYICYPHVNDVIPDPNYPDTLFGGATIRAGATDLDSLLLNFFNRGGFASNFLYYVWAAGPAVQTTFAGSALSVNLCLFGALGPSLNIFNDGYFKRGWISAAGDLNITGSAIYGNARITPACGWTNITQDYWGNCPGFFSMSYTGRGNYTNNINFSIGSSNNFAGNNITLLNNSKLIPAGSGVDAPGVNDANWALGGPVMFWIQNNLIGNTYTYSPPYSTFNIYQITNGAGWNGRFGTGSGGGSSPTNPVNCFVLNLEQRGSGAQYFGPYGILVYNGSPQITPPYVSPGTPGGLSPRVTWNLMNVQISGAQVGIDINTGIQFENNSVV